MYTSVHKSVHVTAVEGDTSDAWLKCPARHPGSRCSLSKLHAPMSHVHNGYRALYTTAIERIAEGTLLQRRAQRSSGATAAARTYACASACV